MAQLASYPDLQSLEKMFSQKSQSMKFHMLKHNLILCHHHQLFLSSSGSLNRPKHQLNDYFSVSDGVRLREERRRDVPVPPGTQQQPPVSQRSLTSRRSSTDSSEDGFNLNVRDLKVNTFVTNLSKENQSIELHVLCLLIYVIIPFWRSSLL